MTNSKRKGASGERELSEKLRSIGLPARRGQQYSGLEGKDVVTLGGLHIECKRVERLDLLGAVAQAKRDAEEHEVPVVCHRRNRTKWLLTVELDSLPRLAELIYLHLSSGENCDEEIEREIT